MLQLIAMASMLIDHVGYFWFPGDDVWRIVGRLAFPIYAYLIVIGMERTRNLNRYLLRLTILAIISQIPYMFFFEHLKLNVIATFALCVWAIQHSVSYTPPMKFFIFLLTASMLELFQFEYGAYALLLIMLYRSLLGYPLVLGHVALNLLYWWLHGWEIQLWSIAPTIGIALYPYLKLNVMQAWQTIRVPSWIWRGFYPGHLLYLFLIKLTQ